MERKKIRSWGELEALILFRGLLVLKGYPMQRVLHLLPAFNRYALVTTVQLVPVPDLDF